MSITALLYVPTNSGSVLEYSVRLGSALVSKHVDVILQTPRRPEWSPSSPLPLEWIRNLRVPSHKVEYGTLAWALDRFWMALTNGVRRGLLARQVSADVVHLQIIAPWADAFQLPFQTRKNVLVCTVHDVVPHVFRLPPTLSIALRKVCYSVADGLVFHSEANVEQFKGVYGEARAKRAVIPHGLVWEGPVSDSQRREARLRLGIPIDRRVLLFFGELRPNKGLDVLLDAFSELACGGCNPYLVIAGRVHPAVDVAGYERRIARLPDGSYRWSRGWVPQDEVGLYFRAASLVVLPYTQFGSQSGVLMKAYSYGCPVVATDVGSLGETIRADQTGLVVPPGRSDRLSSTIERLLHQSSLLHELRSNIAAVANTKYAWSNVARSTIELYERVLH